MIQNSSVLSTPYGEHAVLKFPTKNSLTCSVFDTQRDTYRRLSQQACDILNDLRCKNQLCDCIIQVEDGTKFPVHRPVLSAASGYFRAFFTNGMSDTENKTVQIGGIESYLMQILIEWSYTRNVEINSENIEKLLPLADRFQMMGLVLKCTEFLEKSLHPENVIGIRRFAYIYYLNNLAKTSQNFLMLNFEDVVLRSQEFLEISGQELIEIITNDELNIRNENDLFEIILKWIYFDSETRRQYLGDLLKCLRLGFMTKKYFVERIRKHPFITCDEQLKIFLNECSKFYFEIGTARIADFVDLRVRPRIPHELLVVVGGWSGGSPTSSIETYDPRAGIWQSFEHLDKTPRAYHGCLVMKGYIFVIGGFDGSNCFNNCRRFNLAKRKWQEIAPMYSKRCYVSVAVHSGIIYAMGGYDGSNRLNTAEKYIPELNQWSLIADMNEPRSDASAAELNGKIYICGGFNGTDCIDTAEFYDPESKIWTYIPTMSFKRSGVGLVSYNKALYAIGGYNGMFRLSTCEKYDPKTRRWIRIPDMYTPRSNFGVAVFDECIYVMGGFNGITTIQNVESYNEAEKEWKIREKMNYNRSALSVCTLKGIENVRPYSGLSIRTKLEEEMNQSFLNTILNFSNDYFNYLNSN